jgi:lactoylglutathione lyase
MKKSAILVFALAIQILVWAQDGIKFNFSFNHLALSVKDVDKSQAFYKDVFQLAEITNRTRMDGIRWLSLGEGKELHLISILKEPVVVNKAVHMALTTQKFDEFLTRLKNLGITYSDWPGKPNVINNRADGVKQIYFQDRDGYWIEVNSAYESAPTVQEIKDQIWELEKNYWKYVKQNDLKSYLKLWDENFIGYPGNNKITGKDHITDWISDMYKDKSRKFSYDLTRKVENVFGDIVIDLYDVTQTWTNEKGAVIEKATSKITHTWRKSDASWLIIGGMGAEK